MQKKYFYFEMSFFFMTDFDVSDRRDSKSTKECDRGPTVKCTRIDIKVEKGEIRNFTRKSSSWIWQSLWFFRLYLIHLLIQIWL